MRSRLTATLVGAAILVGGYATVQGGGASTVANLWVDTTGGTCTRQATAGGYSDAGACSSLDDAYTAASAGDTIRVKAGTYGGQRLDYDAGKGTTHVTIRPADGETVTIGNLRVRAKHVTVRDLNLTDALVNPNDEIVEGNASTHAAEDVVLQDLDGRNFEIIVAHDITIQGGDWGPASACGGEFGGRNNSTRGFGAIPESTGIVIDGATIHDIYSMDAATCHTEGLAIFNGEVTVRNSVFYGNDIMDIFTEFTAGPLIFENNWFATPTAEGGTGTSPNCIDFKSGDPAVTLRNNSFSQCAVVVTAGNSPTITAHGNITGGALCGLTGATYTYNVVQDGSPCSGTGNQTLSGAALPYTNTADTSSLDYHLTGGIAQDLIPTGSIQTATDIDGETRPKGSAGDAGADER